MVMMRRVKYKECGKELEPPILHSHFGFKLPEREAPKV